MSRGYSSRGVKRFEKGKRSRDIVAAEFEKRQRLKREIEALSKTELDEIEVEEIRQTVLRGMRHRFF